MRNFWRGILALLALLCGQALWADSWMPATVETYLSEDKQTRLTVTPRDLRSNYEYFKDKVDGKEPAGQQDKGSEHALGLLERRDGSGQWTKVWEKQLVNDVAPVSTLVANAGKYVVTFDNWHSVGHGSDAIVIYDGTGAMVRAMAISEIVGVDYVKALPHSVSSFSWSGDHRITDDGDRLILQIIIPVVPRATDEDTELAPPLEDDNDGYLTVDVDLATGQFTAPSGVDWDRAQKAVTTITAQQAEWERKRVKYLTEPLVGPESYDEPDLHQFLREAFWRISPDWEEGSTSTTVLRLPTAKDYAPSKKWVKEALLKDWKPPFDAAFASPSTENLLIVLRNVVAPLKPGRLNDVTVYIMATDVHWPQIETIFAKSGAKLVQLNPTTPIPQRPERLAELFQSDKDAGQ